MTQIAPKEYLTEKIDNLIKWLETLSFVKNNVTAMSVLPSFRDTEWAIGYISKITPAFDKDPEIVLDDLLKQCNVEKSAFSKEQLDKIRRYLECFVDALKNAK
jgi:glutaminase